MELQRLYTVIRWLTQNKLNLDKTEVMLVRKADTERDCIHAINGLEVAFVEQKPGDAHATNSSFFEKAELVS